MPPSVATPSAVFGTEPDESLIAAFEGALRNGPPPALADFVPPKLMPNRLPTLVELARSDLEWRWDRGTPKPAAAYLAEYPELANASGAVAALAFEEYRARLRRGEPVRPEEIQARYRVTTDSWPAADPPGTVQRTTPAVADAEGTARQPILPVENADGLDEWVKTLPAAAAWPLAELKQSDPAAAAAWRTGVAELPDVGGEFQGFHLIEELGRGAFGRVFLARQGDLAGRLIALKIGTGLFPESQTLAQLQHTNIVPIYSLHQWRNLQGVCMPFFGRTTLSQVLKGLRGHATLPASGDVLLSTVQHHASATRLDSRCGGPGCAPSAPGLAPAAEPATWALVKRLSYPNAVAWLGAQLAAGLAHAHGRGILHRDLKPANVLLTDDGVPMLLDFNLAEDTKAQNQLGGAAVGGTLPYMAPEQMTAFLRLDGQPDARSDVYSLGVMLHELLTGRRPFPEPEKGPLREVVDRLVADRKAAPSARAVNPDVPPAVEAVVLKCLAFDPGARYQSAADLHEDLERHLAHQPLRHAREPLGPGRARKWVARHPRLCSSVTVGIAAAVLLVGVAVAGFYARERSRGYEARAALRDHRAELRSLQAVLNDRNRSANRPDEAVERCRVLLERYGISPDDLDDGWERGKLVRHLPAEDRAALRADAGEVFYLMARSAVLRARLTADPAGRDEQLRRAERWSAAAERYAGDRLPRAVLDQRADLARLRGDAAASQLAAAADGTPPATARDHYLLGTWYAHRGRYREALPYLKAATRLEPENLPAWFVRGTCHGALEQPELAALCFGSCVAIDKDWAPAWFNRGLAYAKMRHWDEACSDYDRALRLDPAMTEALVQRAMANEGRQDLKRAIDDLSEAVAAGGAPTRIYFIRARLRDETMDTAGAAADRAEGMRLTPADERSWVARAEARLEKEPDAALADSEEGLRLNPASMYGLQLKAHILAERQGKPDEAIRVLDRAVELYPEYAPAVAGRGVLLARAGRRVDAVRDAEVALARDARAPNLYQVGCIYALLAKGDAAHKAKAFELVWAALRTGFGLDIVDTDADLDPIRAEPEFRRLVADARKRQAELAR